MKLTQWDFARNQIEISSELRRELDYGYGSPETTIADSIHYYCIHNNDYGYCQVQDYDTLQDIQEWLPAHIQGLLNELTIIDSKGESRGVGSDYFTPSNNQIATWSQDLYAVYN